MKKHQQNGWFSDSNRFLLSTKFFYKAATLTTLAALLHLLTAKSVNCLHINAKKTTTESHIDSMQRKKEKKGVGVEGREREKKGRGDS